MKIQEALRQLRKEKRNFSQSVDLIVNLKKFDPRKQSINLLLQVPYKIKDIKIAGFLEKKSELIDTILEKDFVKYKGKKDIKKLARYDFLIANAKLMPKIATVFGRVLGPRDKMPNPQTGILTIENENEIKKIIDKLEKSIKIKTKEPSVKLSVAKEDMKDEEIIENCESIYHSILNALPNKKENIKSVLIKLTMSKPIKVEI